MRVLILGAGVVGVTTAYALATYGHEVDVIERQPEAGRETSYANAGEVTVGYAGPWSGPGLPLKALKWMFLRHGPMKFRPTWDPAMFDWMRLWWTNCSIGRYRNNKQAMVALAAYSLERLQIWRESLELDYDQRSLGTLQLFRESGQLAAASKDMEVLRQLGIEHELLDRAGCLKHEPALGASEENIAGGLRLPGDETGDCHVFTKAVARHAQRLGVRFHFNTDIRSLTVRDGRVAGCETDHGFVSADACVMALGSHSAPMLRSLGIRVPVYPLKGYSLTAPLLADARAPRSTVLDESSKVAITRLGTRLRVGGIAELCGFDTSLPAVRRETLERAAAALFPGAADLASAEFWCGLRAVTPDGPPLVGRAGYPNLYLNTGHGSFGWTMACGSADLLASVISGRQAALPLAPYSAERYARSAI